MMMEGNNGDLHLVVEDEAVGGHRELGPLDVAQRVVGVEHIFGSTGRARVDHLFACYEADPTSSSPAEGHRAR